MPQNSAAEGAALGSRSCCQSRLTYPSGEAHAPSRGSSQESASLETVEHHDAIDRFDAPIAAEGIDYLTVCARRENSPYGAVNDQQEPRRTPPTIAEGDPKTGPSSGGRHPSRA